MKGVKSLLNRCFIFQHFPVSPMPKVIDLKSASKRFFHQVELLLEIVSYAHGSLSPIGKFQTSRQDRTFSLILKPVKGGLGLVLE